MAASFFFYDLETSGVNARTARIMQFAGQRTDMDLKPIGEPVNMLVKLTEDVLPEPDAVMITGITPQMTLADGVTEAEFFKFFCSEVVQPDTIFIGFNSVRFDDEFMRFGLYRNFYDPYEWQWKDGCSRWDMLDVVRMTRALRPEGINWPFASDGKPTNRLELLTQLNGLEHDSAHDALSDVTATIAVAKLIKDKQPKLFEFMFQHRTKQQVQQFVQRSEQLVYVSGKYAADYEKLTVVSSLGDAPNNGGVLVYDLRHDPSQYRGKKAEELAELWRYKKDSDQPRLPVKTLKFNTCPAIAPLAVLLPGDKKRLQLDMEKIAKHYDTLQAMKDGFYSELQKATEILKADYQQTDLIPDEQRVDGALYDGFIQDHDKQLAEVVRRASPDEMMSFKERFNDNRLKALLPLYKARNFPRNLDSEEREQWEDFRTRQLERSLPPFMSRLATLAADPSLSGEKQYLLGELQLYAESIMPEQNL